MDKLKNTRILALIGLICLFLGVVMPYFSISIFGYSYNINLWGYWEGKVIVILIIANALFIYRDYIEKYVPQLFKTGIGSKIQNANSKFSIVPTIAVAAFAIWLFIRLDVDTTYIKYGLGFWLLWIGVICLVAHIFIYKKENNVVNQYQQQVNYTQVNNPQQPVNQQDMNAMNTQSSNIKYCPGCGNKCDINADKCFMCGRQF